MKLLRLLYSSLAKSVAEKHNVLLLGARQTGKSTLAEQFELDLKISLLRPGIRQRYEKNAELFIQEIEALAEELGRMPLIMLDEVQLLPILLDATQYLIDEKIAQFIITGSSARKLRTDKVNLLPGRIRLFHLDPLLYQEQAELEPTLEDILLYGDLPGVVLAESAEDKAKLLQDYVITYIEAEIRSEAAVRNVNSFVRFLPLAAEQSGQLVNFNKFSQEVGVTHGTIAAYYQILEDCLIAYRVEPITKSIKRSRLVKTAKYVFFDLGVRRFCEQDTDIHYDNTRMANFFEQYVGLTLLRWLNVQGARQTLYFWRDNNGPEVDWVLRLKGQYIPIEVKWTDKPKASDARHLQLFLNEYDDANIGYIICRVKTKVKLADNLYALPWQALDTLLTD
jgi:predicted AAA+ superfamily ATPase